MDQALEKPEERRRESSRRTVPTLIGSAVRSLTPQTTEQADFCPVCKEELKRLPEVAGSGLFCPGCAIKDAEQEDRDRQAAEELERQDRVKQAPLKVY
jgi:predicted amidophosphoribosyltransferase